MGSRCSCIPDRSSEQLTAGGLLITPRRQTLEAALNNKDYPQLDVLNNSGEDRNIAIDNEDIPVSDSPKKNTTSSRRQMSIPKSTSHDQQLLSSQVAIYYDTRDGNGSSFHKMITNEIDTITQRDSSLEKSKKNVSFLHFASLESNPNTKPKEFASPLFGQEWRLKNIRLNILMQQGPRKYLWEAENTINGQICTVKICLFETSKLAHHNFLKPETVLRELASIDNPHVLDIYSFSMFEAEIHSKSHLVVTTIQEKAKCSLRDLHRVKIETGQNWTQDEVLKIINDIYKGLLFCKGYNLIHGKLIMENVLLTEDGEKFALADFDLKFSFNPEGRRSRSSQVRSNVFKFRGPSLAVITEESAGNLDFGVSEKDMQDLVVIVMKLITQNENLGFSFETLKNDREYKVSYFYVFEVLEMMVNRRKTAQEIGESLEALIKDKKVEFEFSNMNNDGGLSTVRRGENHVDHLFLKIDCYEILKERETAIGIYEEVINIIKEKEVKQSKEYYQYVKCINRTIKHHILIADWLKAKEIGDELKLAFKQEESLRMAMKRYPQEYIVFLFLLGNTWEGLNEIDKAIKLYLKGLSFCSQLNMGLEIIPSVLRKISNLCIQKRDLPQAFTHLNKLVLYYESEEGYFHEKAESYEKMGNIALEEEDAGLAVKKYLKSLENLHKISPEKNEDIMKLLQKIVNCYNILKEYDNAIKYRMEVLSLKKKMNNGKDQEGALEDIRIIGELHYKTGNYEAALGSYLIYQKAVEATPDFNKNIEYIRCYLYLGDTYAVMKQFEHARNYYVKFVNGMRSAHGESDQQYLTCFDKIAVIYFEEKQFEKALELQLQTMENLKKNLNQEDLYYILSLNNIGDTYFVLHKRDKALEYYEKCLEILNKNEEVMKEERAMILRRIAVCYELAGKNGEALEYLYKSFKAFSKKGGESDLEKTIKTYDFLNGGKETRVSEINFSHLDFFPF